MIGLTSKITDKVSFGRRNHPLHPCPRMKQVWQNAWLKCNWVMVLFSVIKETYAAGTARIRTEKLSGKIKIIKGVLQGDTLSPVTFTAAIEEICKRMNSEAGININGVRLSNLSFTYDIIMFAESEELLKDMLADLNTEGKRDGMKVNKK